MALGLLSPLCAAAQPLYTTHSRQYPGAEAGIPPLDIGPWPPLALQRSFEPAPTGGIVYSIDNAKLVNVAKPAPELSRACRGGELAVPEPTPQAVIGGAYYDAGRGRQLIGQKKWLATLAPDMIYVFRNALTTACAVWVINPLNR